jgi:hypothetical protein
MRSERISARLSSKLFQLETWEKVRMTLLIARPAVAAYHVSELPGMRRKRLTAYLSRLLQPGEHNVTTTTGLQLTPLPLERESDSLYSPRTFGNIRQLLHLMNICTVSSHD